MKKILIPMVEAGSGHQMPALVVNEALDRLYPGLYEVRVVDFARECGALRSDKAIKGAQDIVLAHRSPGVDAGCVEAAGNPVRTTR